MFIIVCGLVDRYNNFYFHLFLAAWNQLITLIIMNFNVYNKNTIFNIDLAMKDIMNNAMHMACIELNLMISVIRDQSLI